MDATKNSHDTDTLRKFRETTMELDNLYSTFPKSCGLSEPEYWSLLLICEGVTTQTQISGQLFMSRQTLNSAFKQLVKKGLIILQPCENNQRTKQAILTSQGRSLVENQVLQMHRIEELAWSCLEEDEQEMLSRLTRKFTDVLGKTLGTVSNDN